MKERAAAAAGMCESSERREKLGGAGVGFARLHRREEGAGDGVASAAAVSITLRRRAARRRLGLACALSCAGGKSL